MKALARLVCAIATLAVALPPAADRDVARAIPGGEPTVVEARTPAPTLRARPAGDGTLQFRHTLRAAGRDAPLLPQNAVQPSIDPAGAVEITILDPSIAVTTNSPSDRAPPVSILG